MCFLVSCQVANVCTLEQHLQAYKLSSQGKKSMALGGMMGTCVSRSCLGLAYNLFEFATEVEQMLIGG